MLACKGLRQAYVRMRTEWRWIERSSRHDVSLTTAHLQRYLVINANVVATRWRRRRSRRRRVRTRVTSEGARSHSVQNAPLLIRTSRPTTGCEDGVVYDSCREGAGPAPADRSSSSSRRRPVLSARAPQINTVLERHGSWTDWPTDSDWINDQRSATTHTAAAAAAAAMSWISYWPAVDGLLDSTRRRRVERRDVQPWPSVRSLSLTQARKCDALGIDPGTYWFLYRATVRLQFCRLIKSIKSNCNKGWHTAARTMKKLQWYINKRQLYI